MFSPLSHSASNGHSSAHAQQHVLQSVVPTTSQNPRFPFPFQTADDFPSDPQKLLSPQGVSKPSNYEGQGSKRDRDASDDCDRQSKNPTVIAAVPQAVPVPKPQAPPSLQGEGRAKRTRPNNYIAPRVVPTTFTSAMGSLVKNGASTGSEKSNSRVQLRRQLSGGNLDAYLGSDDGMEVDIPEQRPRSMSF